MYNTKIILLVVLLRTALAFRSLDGVPSGVQLPAVAQVATPTFVEPPPQASKGFMNRKDENEYWHK